MKVSLHALIAYIRSKKYSTYLKRAYLTGGDVATTDQLRQLWRLGRPKNGLRSHQGDVAATAETDQSRRLGRPTHGLRSHVAETCLNFPRLPGDPASLQET